MELVYDCRQFPYTYDTLESFDSIEVQYSINELRYIKVIEFLCSFDIKNSFLDVLQSKERQISKHRFISIRRIQCKLARFRMHINFYFPFFKISLLNF